MKFHKCTTFPRWHKTIRRQNVLCCYHSWTISHFLWVQSTFTYSYLYVYLGKEFSNYQSHFSLDDIKKKKWVLKLSLTVQVLQPKEVAVAKLAWLACRRRVSWRCMGAVAPLTTKAQSKPGHIALFSYCVLGQTLLHLSFFIHWCGILLLMVHSKMCKINIK